jgi:curved DNA-binding protein CbpA
MFSPADLMDIKKAYLTLNIPFTAPAPLIKKAYLALVKKWHPDRLPQGSLEHVKATERMKEINNAYALVRHAPLRYHISSYPQAEERRKQSTTVQDSAASETKDTMPINDRGEFWLRFIFGAFTGAFFGLSWLLSFYDNERIAIGGYIIIILGFALCSVRWGSRFWETIIRYWWVWP